MNIFQREPVCHAEFTLLNWTARGSEFQCENMTCMFSGPTAICLSLLSGNRQNTVNIIEVCDLEIVFIYNSFHTQEAKSPFIIAVGVFGHDTWSRRPNILKTKVSKTRLLSKSVLL